MSGHELARKQAAQSDCEVLADVTGLLQHVHVPCWLLDAEGVFTWVNDAFVAAFGDRRGAHYSTFIAPESLEAAEQHFGAMHGNNPAVEVELDLLRPDGSRVHTEISSVLLQKIGLCCGAFGVAATGVRPRSTHPDLTPRQTDVLLLLAGGASTDQIARELHLSKTTVRNHVSKILQVLDVHSRLAAVAKARREGLLGD